jgi:hypothetical protein
VTGPASPHRHVQEGICLCEVVYDEVVTGGLLFEPGLVRRYATGLRYSAACGLSSHRVRARAEE